MEFGHIIFEKLKPSNIDELHSIDFSKSMMKYITGNALSFEEAALRYSRDIDHPHFGSYFVKGAQEEETLGFAVIKKQPGEAEIGYLVLPPYRGKGLATVINKRLIKICLEKLQGFRIVAYTDKRNTASIRVLEKSGMRKVESVEVEGTVQYKYGFTRDESSLNQ